MNFEKLRNIAVGLAVMVALAFTVSTGPVSAEMKKKEFKVVGTWSFLDHWKEREAILERTATKTFWRQANC